MRLDAIPLSAAEGIEKRLGSGAGYRAYRALIDGLPPGDTRRRAILGALRCAAHSGEALEEIPRAIALWERAGPGEGVDTILAIALNLHRAGHAIVAVALARAEISRAPSARAWLGLGRLAEDAGDDESARTAFLESGRLATSTDAATERAARLALVRLALRRGDGVTALAEADALGDDPSDDHWARLALAAARLASSRRYGRVAALDALDDLAVGATADLASAAVRIAARHADQRGTALTTIEIDRVRTILSRAPDRDVVESALARLDAISPCEAGTGAVAPADEVAVRHAARVRSVLDGAAPVPDEVRGPEEGAARDALLALAALRDGRHGDAVDALHAVRHAAAETGRVGRVAWAAVSVALGAPDATARSAAVFTARTLVASSTTPPFGVRRIARALAEAGDRELALRVLDRAALSGDSEATEAAVLHRAREGWAAAARGERDRAIEILRAARALASRMPRDPSTPRA